MDTLGSWLGIVGFVVAIAATLGAAVGIFKANIAKATIEGQAHRIDTLEGELKDEKQMRQRDALRISEQEARLAVQAQEIDTLSRLKTGQEELLTLARVLDKHHTETIRQFDDNHSQEMARLAEILEKLAPLPAILARLAAQ